MGRLRLLPSPLPSPVCIHTPPRGERHREGHTQKKTGESINWGSTLKTMAQLTGLLSRLTGSMGNLTFKRSAGRTIVSEKPSVVNNPRTTAQQKHRMKWPNLIKIYAGVSPLLNCAFENRPRLLSDYNMFVKVNFAASTVYLTRSECQAGAAVAAPYQITGGSLPTIGWTGEAGASVTDIAVGSLTLTPETTVRELSNAIVEHNADYEYGDQISFILVMQTVGSVSGCPECQFRGESIVLDKLATARVYDLVSRSGFSVKDGHLAAALDSSFQGAYAWVHTRKSASGTQVSSQALTVRSDIYEAYSTEAAYRRAVASYGGEKDNFLTPSDTQTPTRGTIGGDTPSTPQVKTYSVALSASPAVGGTVSGAGNYVEDTKAELKATPAAGYVFVKWGDGNTQNPRQLTVDKDYILAAIFQKQEEESGGGVGI